MDRTGSYPRAGIAPNPSTGYPHGTFYPQPTRVTDLLELAMFIPPPLTVRALAVASLGLCDEDLFFYCFQWERYRH
jgi:hypothetical protein